MLPASLLVTVSVVRAGAFTVDSPDIPRFGVIPPHFEHSAMGCQGKNLSPELRWRGAPEGTRSFAVTVIDLDANGRRGAWHWIVINLPAHATTLPRGVGSSGSARLPGAARQALNDFGVSGWTGVCPPRDDPPHRYLFTVHAIAVDHIEAAVDEAPSVLISRIGARSVAKTSLIARSAR